MKRGSVIDDTGYFPNLITNWGLDQFGTQQHANVTRYCHVGVGTAAPQFTDTSLQERVAHTTFTGNRSGSMASEPPYYSETRYTYDFGLGAVAGNLTEIGIGNNSNLWSRALIVDASGNPTSFPVASDEQLIASYRLRLYVPEGDTEGQITIGSTVYDYLCRAAGATNYGAWGFPSLTGNNDPMGAVEWIALYSGTVGEVTARPGGSRSAFTGTQQAPYSPGSYYRDSSVSFSTTQGNGTWQSLSWGLPNGSSSASNDDAFQCQLTPALVKTSDEVMVLNQRISWGRR